jgi:plastocyanin
MLFPASLVVIRRGFAPVQAGVNADALSHEDYLNGPGETVSSTFTKAGTYEYYCQPHSGSMQGKIIVVE